MQNNKRNLPLKIALLSVCLITASINAVTANIPEMAKTFSDVPLYTIELIATVPSLFQMLSVILGPVLLRSLSYKRRALIGLICCGVGGSLPLFIQNFALIFGSRCLLGFGCGLITPALLAMIVRFFTADTRSAMIGFTGSVGGLGSALSSFVAGRLLTFGWNVSFAVYFAAFAVLALVALLVPELPRENSAAAHTAQYESSRPKNWAALITTTLMSFISTLLATFFIVKASTLITATGLGSAQNGSLAITFISIGSLLAGAMYGRLYAKLKAKALVLFYLVSAAGLFCGVIASLPVIYFGAFLIGWGLIAFSPYFQDKASRDYSHFGETAATFILVSQALGAFAAPYYGNLLQMITPVLTAQFALTGAGYLVLAAIALALSLRPAHK